jgi:hypothetical protein
MGTYSLQGQYAYVVPPRSNRLRNIFIGTVLVLAVVWLFLTPYLAVFGLVRAIQGGDVEAVSDGINFPAFRESLKNEMSGQLVGSMVSDGEANGFAALGTMLAAGVFNAMIDNLVTPQGMVNLTRGSNSNTTQTRLPDFVRALSDKHAKLSMHYKSWDRFTVSADNAMELIWRRSGLMTWRLSAIHLAPAVAHPIQSTSN